LREKQWLEWIGSKNIVFHAKGKYYLVTTLGNKEIKARNFKSQFGTKDIRFASQEEIRVEIWWTIGCIPPFGFENENIPLFIDTEIFDFEYFIFNPWDTTKSIQIVSSNLKKIYENLKNPMIFFHFDWEEKEFEKLEKKEV
jgi:prolyl-tRNA editing enzyme YbaK/EbsC (Cys-tRNA(Pro) deacylase)